MNKPLISVVMSVYNSEKYLDEAIQSILNQTYTDFEFIIINDGSTDNSLDIINKYKNNDDRIILISRENKGLPYSLNEGMKNAKGKYIARMDADDISLPNRFKEQIIFMEENPNIGICGTWAEVFEEGKDNKFLKHPFSHDELKVRLLFSVCFVHPTVMIRKKILDDNNLKYNLDYINAQDYELWSKVSEVTNMANIQKVLLKYRISGSSITKVTDSIKTELRYKLLSRVFGEIINKLNINNTEEENKLHFIIGSNERTSKENLDLKVLNNYFNKIIEANKTIQYFDEKFLIKFLSRKFLVAIYYQIKRKNYQFFNIAISNLLYKSIFNIIKVK